MTGRLQRQNARCASAFKRWAPSTRRLCRRRKALPTAGPTPLEHGQGAGGGDAREVCGRQAQSLDRTHVPVIVFAPPSSCSPPTACSRRPRCTCPPHPTTARLAASRARVAPCGARCPDASSAADLRAKPAQEEMADAGVGAWGDEGRMVRRFSFVLTRRRESCAATRLLCPPTHSRTRCRVCSCAFLVPGITRPHLPHPLPFRSALSGLLGHVAARWKQRGPPWRAARWRLTVTRPRRVRPRPAGCMRMPRPHKRARTSPAGGA